MNYYKAIENIRNELKSYIQENNLKSLILGISGGIDSALCAVLAKSVCDDLKIKLYGRSISISSNKPSEIERANEIGNQFCHDFEEVNLTNLYESFSNEINSSNNPNKEWKIRNGNIKARLRMIYLYNLASTHNGMVLSTDNYTEYLLGFWTLGGDIGDYGMIQNLWKTEVYCMFEWFSDNEFKKEKEIINKVLIADATDGLGISNTDLDQIMPKWNGSSRDGYKIVDKKIQIYINIGIGNLDDPVIHRHLNSKFKRKIPINIPRNKIME